MKNINAIKYARILGVFLLLTAIVLLFTNPTAENNLPQGFRTPILAFEFIQNKQEIIDFFDVKQPATYISKMLCGNAIDYAFMFIYSFFLAFIAIHIYQKTGKKSMYVALFFCVLMCIGDALENLQIYHLVSKFSNSNELVTSELSYNFYDIHITLLKFFTWLKWFSIAFTFALFSSYFLKEKITYKTIGILCILSFCLSILAFFNHGILNEVFSTSVILVFLSLNIFVFTYKNKVL